MLRKILFVTAAAIAVMMVAAPALAFDGCGIGGCGIGYGGYGLGYGGYGCGAAAGAVSYGAPQDCVATISCNIPATQMVPYMTSTTQMQTYTYPVVVPQQSAVTVPKAVIVPEQVPVTTYRTECAQGACPVQVPAVAYAPVTYNIPQTYTVCLGSTGGSVGQIYPSSAAPYGQEQYQQMPPQQMPPQQMPQEQYQQMPPQQMPQQYTQQLPQQQ